MTQVFISREGNGTARATVSDGSDDHTYDVWVEGDRVLVDYQESCSWRGAIRVAEPPDTVFRTLVQSDEMSALCEQWDADGVTRASPQA